MQLIKKNLTVSSLPDILTYQVVEEKVENKATNHTEAKIEDKKQEHNYSKEIQILNEATLSPKLIVHEGR